MKLGFYKVILFVYVFEGYIMVIFGLMIVVYKVFSVLNIVDIDDEVFEREVVVSLMFLIINNVLRYYLVEFFFLKFFD